MVSDITIFGGKIDLLNSEVTITEEALIQIYKSMDGIEPKELILTVRGGGCSGYIYDLEVISDEIIPPEKSDTITFNLPDSTPTDSKSIKLHIPYQVIPLVKGTEIWYDSRLVNGGIKFRNPNANRTCGCGESFS